MDKAEKEKKKLERELDAQRKRVEALAYLSKHGATQSDIQVLISRGKPVEKIPVKTTDNTLDCLLKQNVKQYEQKNLAQLKADLIKQQYGGGSSSSGSKPNPAASANGESTKLPANWQALKCSTSGEFYYWNQVTNETTWEAPTGPAAAAVRTVSRFSDRLPPGWAKKTHPATNQVFYLHEASGGIRSAKPTEDDFYTDDYKMTMSAAATQAPTSTKTSFSLKRKPEQDSSKAKGNKRVELDPLDWMVEMKDGRASVGKMADSTAGGPLWQQRPYPAPGQALKGKPPADAKDSNPVNQPFPQARF